MIRRSRATGLVAGALALGLIGGVVIRDVAPTTWAAPSLPSPSFSAPAAQPATPVFKDAASVQSALVSVAEQVGPAVVSVRTDSRLGSGVIYDSKGLILTNAHVVDGAKSITVGLADGRHFKGKVLGADAGFDLAVVQVNAQNLPSAELGDSSSLQVGEMVVAIGNPYGFDHTVTNGVVSALNRPISEGRGSYAQPMIQTNAAINPGNSGGPLVDLNGRVIGITTLVAAPDGYPAQGLGFAVPIDTAKRIAPQLANDGQVSHTGQPYLGVSLGDQSSGGSRQQPFPYQPPRSRQTPAGVDHGALVGQVVKGGPADQAGLKAGDVITVADGKEVYTSDDLLQAVVLHKPGDQLQLTVVRNGSEQSVTVTLGEMPVQQ